MAKIKFERTSAPTGSVEFSRNPSRGDFSRTTKYKQPQDSSDGGDIYIYNKGITAEAHRELRWRNISSLDLSNFMTFLGVVVGAKYNFTFTDFDGTTATARIINSDEIASAPVAPGRESLTVKLRIE